VNQGTASNQVVEQPQQVDGIRAGDRQIQNLKEVQKL
jgi:hypothetical protein